MPPLKNLKGETFGRLTVIKLVRPIVRITLWKCRCSCGKVVTIRSSDLIKGKSKSCGCLRKEVISKLKTTHGRSNSSEFRIWCDIRQRCENPNAERYKDYGGRGIRVCERWQTFSLFLTDMGERPSSEYQIDRINNNGDYSPDNCHWTTCTVNNRNRRDSKLWFVDNIRYESKYQAALSLGVSPITIKRWCEGRGNNPPKPNCYSEIIHQNQIVTRN